jgi:peptidoglycan-associated lipoprotein
MTATVCCRPEAQVRRFTNFKWLIAGLLLLALLFTWMNARKASAPAVATPAASAPAALVAASLGVQASKDEVVLSGRAPDESSKAQWLAAATAAFAGKKIVDQIQVQADTAPVTFSDKLTGLFDQVKGWDAGGLTLQNDSVILSGEVPNDSTRQQRAQWAQTLFGAGTKLDNQLSIAAAAATVAPAVAAPTAEPSPAPTAASSIPPVSAPAPAQSSACEAISGKGAVVYFGTGSAGLSAKSLKALRELAKCFPDKQIEVVGHTDERGSDVMNQRLSERRAAAVASSLAKAGITKGNVKVLAKGEAEPASSGSGEANWSKNRRVEVRLL